MPSFQEGKSEPKYSMKKHTIPIPIFRGESTMWVHREGGKGTHAWSPVGLMPKLGVELGLPEICSRTLGASFQ